MHKSETWNSVTAKEQFKSATITDAPNGDYRVLQHSNGVEFSGIIGKILLLPATESWHVSLKSKDILLRVQSTKIQALYFQCKFQISVTTAIFFT